MKIKQHIPKFVDHGKAEEVNFGSIDGLLSIHWVREFKKDPKFKGFSINLNTDESTIETSGSHTLVANHVDGVASVVGFISGEGVQELIESTKPRTPRDLTLHKNSNTLTRKAPKVYRNEPCTCGSGVKAKKCCYSPYSE